MFVAYIVVTVATIVANAGIVAADLLKAKSVVANSAEVGLPESWLPLLATLKAAGAAGLLFGILGIEFLGIAAAIGLVLFFIGALVAHLRARVFHNIYYPGTYWLLAVGSLVLAIAR